MSRSKLWSLVVAPAVLLLAGVNPPAAHAQRPEAARNAARPDAAAPDDRIARGRYIVESVAMCTRCHSPVDSHGNRDTSLWLQGGPTGLAPTVPTEGWMMIAPRIGGGPPGTDAEFIRLLTTGISRHGTQLRPPMPQFRMTQDDAEAVLAYLKSVQSRHPAGTN
jgi:mono/diheme cytochrome c family protein